MKVLAFLSCILIWLQTAGGANTLGKACTIDVDCKGQNEICQRATWLQPGCTTGTCVCKTNYTNQDFTGYSPWSHATADCVPLKALKLNDTCQGDGNEIILVSNAECNSDVDKVKCIDGAIEYKSFCLKNYGFGFAEGAYCMTSSQCAGEMTCGEFDQICQCPFHLKYDSSTGRCLKREYGDACKEDKNCLTMASDWDGYTSFSGACINGKCGCAVDAKSVVVTYFDAFTGNVKDKTICVTKKTTTGLTNKNTTLQCYVDPAYWSEASTYGICSQGYVCVPCPDDTRAFVSGHCHAPIATRPVMLSYTLSGALPKIASGATAPADALITPAVTIRTPALTRILKLATSTVAVVKDPSSSIWKSWEIGLIFGVVGVLAVIGAVVVGVFYYKKRFHAAQYSKFSSSSRQQKKNEDEKEHQAVFNSPSQAAFFSTPQYIASTSGTAFPYPYPQQQGYARRHVPFTTTNGVA